jgi:hypothetical protein
MARAAEGAGRAVDVMPCGVSFNSQWLDEKIVHGERSADEQRWGMSRAELEKRILRLRIARAARAY